MMFPFYELKFMAGNPAKYGPMGNLNAFKHGLTTLKHSVKSLVGREIEMRTALGKTLGKWRADLILVWAAKSQSGGAYEGQETKTREGA